MEISTAQLNKIYMPQKDFFKKLIDDCINTIIPCDYATKYADITLEDDNARLNDLQDGRGDPAEASDIKPNEITMNLNSITVSPAEPVPGDHAIVIGDNFGLAAKETHPPCEPILGNCYESCQPGIDGAGDVETNPDYLI